MKHKSQKFIKKLQHLVRPDRSKYNKRVIKLHTKIEKFMNDLDFVVLDNQYETYLHLNEKKVTGTVLFIARNEWQFNHVKERFEKSLRYSFNTWNNTVSFMLRLDDSFDYWNQLEENRND